MKYAVRGIRTGNLHSIRLLNLLNLEDSSTKDYLLKGFEKLPRDKAVEYMNKALHKFEQITIIAFPLTTIDTFAFFSCLGEKLCLAISTGADWFKISSWLSAVWRKVSKDFKAYDTGDRVAPAEFNLSLDLLDSQTTARRELDIEVGEKRAVAAAKLALESSTARSTSQSTSRATPTSTGPDTPATSTSSTKKSKSKGSSSSPPAKRVRDETEIQVKVETQHASGVTPGKSVVIPGNGKGNIDYDKVKAWSASVDPTAEKVLCWNFHHPQGCSKGAQCKFTHSR
jgi:hypothetical protein